MEAPNTDSLGAWLAEHGLPERDVVRLYRELLPLRRWLSATFVTEALARVEGEGALHVRVRDGRVDDVRLRIYEPPRFFEAFLRGRRFTEVPDITARICGICPVAYQTSSMAAMEDACGVQVPEAIWALRRLLYCGEWIESHALHVFFLHAPDFLGYASAFEMARDHRAIVEGALALKKAGQHADARRRRARDPSRQRARRRRLPRAGAGRAAHR